MPSPGENNTLDRDRLREATLDDDALMEEVLSILVDDTSRQIGLLDRAIHEQNAQQCARLAHYSKGACANVGAQRAATLLREIEQCASLQQFARCGVSLQELARELDMLRAEILRKP